MNDLKCCPFCGGEAEVGLTNQHDKLFIVGCNTPMCYGNINHFTMSFVSKESAINTWNTRAPMDNIVEKLEEELLTSESAHEEAVIGMCGVSASGYSGEISAYTKAINIVKQEINNGLE